MIKEGCRIGLDEKNVKRMQMYGYIYGYDSVTCNTLIKIDQVGTDHAQWAQ